MATHSSIFVWRIPWTEEPGGLPSMGSHRVGHKWSNLAAAAAAKPLWDNFQLTRDQLGFPGGSVGRESACNAGGTGQIPGSRRSPGGGHGNSSQYSCLENPMDRGAGRATVHGVTKSQPQLMRLSTRAEISLAPGHSLCSLGLAPRSQCELSIPTVDFVKPNLNFIWCPGHSYAH